MRTKTRAISWKFFLLLLGFLLAAGFLTQWQQKNAEALTTAETSGKNKTAVFHVMQSPNVLFAVTCIPDPCPTSTTTSFTIFVGDNAPVASSSYVQVEGVVKVTGAETITIDIKQLGIESFPTPRARTFTVNATGEDSPFAIYYQGNDSTGNDLTTYLNSVITSSGSYTFEIKVDFLGNDISLLSGKMVLTYGITPPSTGATVPNGANATYFAFQEAGIVATAGSIQRNFDVFVGEPSPVVKNAYLLVRGVTKAAAAQNITIDIKQSGVGSFPTPRARTFTVNATGKDAPFEILYYGNDTTGDDLTSYLASIVVAPSITYTFTVKIDISGADASLLHGRLIMNYQFTQGGGGLPAVGTIESSSFDTYTVNGANYNWILWKGTKPGTSRIRLQFATSNCENGATDSPTCATGSWGSGSNYGGSDCTSSTWFEPLTSGTQSEIPKSCSHHNKRYFRYKVQLCSNSDCSTSGNDNPAIDDVIVNWSP